MRAALLLFSSLALCTPKLLCVQTMHELGLPVVYEGEPGIPGGVPFPKGIPYHRVQYLNSGGQGNVFRVFPKEGEPYILKQFHSNRLHFSEDVALLRLLGELPGGNDRFTVPKLAHVDKEKGYLTYSDVRGQGLLQVAGTLEGTPALAEVKALYNDRMLALKKDLTARGWTAQGMPSADGFNVIYFKKGNQTIQMVPQNIIFNAETGRMMLIDMG